MENQDVKQYSWGVFAFRLVIIGIATFGIAFGVTDYVVKAHVAGLQTAIQQNSKALEQSLSAYSNSMVLLNEAMADLNKSVREQTASSNRLSSELAKLSNGYAEQRVDITYIKDDIGKIQTAIQTAGIPIPAQYETPIFDPKIWAKFREQAGISDTRPILLDADSFSELFYNKKKLDN